MQSPHGFELSPEVARREQARREAEAAEAARQAQQIAAQQREAERLAAWAPRRGAWSALDGAVRTVFGGPQGGAGLE